MATQPKTRDVALRPMPLHGKRPAAHHHIEVAPHGFARVAWWRRRLCRYCYAPRALHPRKGWVRARALGDRRFLSVRAPHFNEGW